jgi:hypothetical protein
MGLINLLAPTKSNKRADNDRMTILIISILLCFKIIKAQTYNGLVREVCQGSFFFSHNPQNTFELSYCVE